MPAATSDDVRDIFLDHLDRLRAAYATRGADCRASADAAAESDGWTAGLDRGLAMAYNLVAEDLAEAIKVERRLTRTVTSIPGGH